MKILIAPNWQDYELLDSGDGKRLERFGKYEDLSFWIKLSPFKHTGVFPEQSIHWDWIRNVISNDSEKSQDSSLEIPRFARNDREVNILNLFGYTGIASLAAAAAGAHVTHIDASYPTIGWAKENAIASNLQDKPIRWILDDALKFVGREIKRGVKYDGIIMIRLFMAMDQRVKFGRNYKKPRRKYRMWRANTERIKL